MNENSITIKELYESGRISFYLSKEALKGRAGRKELIKIHRDGFEEFGHVVKITPSDISLKLHETKAPDREGLDATLWPDKPLDSIGVENEPLCYADNRGFVKHVRMGTGFYTISMNPRHRNPKYGEKFDKAIGIKVYRL